MSGGLAPHGPERSMQRFLAESPAKQKEMKFRNSTDRGSEAYGIGVAGRASDLSSTF